MKKTLLLLASATVALTACNQHNQRVNESAGLQKDQVQREAEATRDQLNQAQKEVDRQAAAQKEHLDRHTVALRDSAREQKKQVERSAEAKKAELELAKKNVMENAKLEKKSIEQSADAHKSTVIHEAAGARRDLSLGTVTTADPLVTDLDRNLSVQVRRSMLLETGREADSLATRNVVITAANGDVTLRGIVLSNVEKQRMEASARAVPGVVRVVNLLEVKP